MDVFEYATLTLTFHDVDLGITESEDGPWHYKKTRANIEIKIGEQITTTEGETFKQHVTRHNYDRFRPKERHYLFFTYTPLIPDQYIMETLVPKMTEMGKEGWEVLEYKFSTDSNFAFALLKRKVQP